MKDHAESFINWNNFEKVFRSGKSAERERYQRAIEYARNISTTDIHAFKNLQPLFESLLNKYPALNPYDLEEEGVSARERIMQAGKSGAYDYRVIFDILASARQANRVLQVSDERNTRVALFEYRFKKGEAIGRLQTGDGDAPKRLAAHHQIAQLVEQFIVDGKLSLVSDPLRIPDKS